MWVILAQMTQSRQKIVLCYKCVRHLPKSRTAAHTIPSAIKHDKLCLASTIGIGVTLIGYVIHSLASQQW